MEPRFSENATIEGALSVQDIVLNCLKTCDVSHTLNTLKQVSQAWSRCAQMEISDRRGMARAKLASLYQAPRYKKRLAVAASWLHSAEGGGWTGEDVASWFCSDTNWDAAHVVCWLFSKEGANWEVTRVASWLCSKEGPAWDAVRVASWLRSAGWETTRVASWLYSEEGADWEAVDVATWLCSTEDAAWDAVRVASWLRSAGWETVRVASWLYSSEEGANWEGAKVATWLYSTEGPAKVASWLCSKEGAGWEIARVACWLCSDTDWEVVHVASWLCSKRGSMEGADWEATPVASWLCGKEGTDFWAVARVASWETTSQKERMRYLELFSEP